MYRSFVMCDDPKGVVECGTNRKSKTSSQKMEHPIVSRKSQNRSNKTGLTDKTEKEEEMVSKSISAGEKYLNPSSFQLLDVSKGAEKLNQVIDSWSKGIVEERGSKDIARDLLKGTIDLQESLVMLGKLQEASEYMAQLKKKKRQKQKQEQEQEQELERRIDDVETRRTYSHQLASQQPRLSADGYSRDCIDELKKAIRDGFARQNLAQNTAIHEKIYYDRRKEPALDVPSTSSSQSSAVQFYSSHYTDASVPETSPFRDGFARQNLVHNTAIHEKIHFDRRKKDSALDVPSTSSSQWSAAQNYSSHYTDASVLETAPRKSEIGVNLVARLMGLEKMPSKPLPQAQQKQLDVEKRLSQRRPFFDIEMPKLRNPQPIVQKVDSDKRTMKEILETMQFKGLLKSHSVNDLKFLSHHCGDSRPNEMLSDDIPPIVLIKPYGSCMKSEDIPATLVWESEASKTKTIPRKMKVEEGLPPRLIDSKGDASYARKMHFQTEEKEIPIKRLNQYEGAKHRRKVTTKPVEKEINVVVQEQDLHRKVGAEEASTKRCSQDDRAKKMDRKVKAEIALMKRCSQEDGTKDNKEEAARTEEGKSKTKRKGSSKTKAPGPLPQQQKKELKADKVQKVLATSRKPVNPEVVKLKNTSISQDQFKETSARLRNPGDVSVITKTSIPRQHSVTPKIPVKQTTKSIIHTSEKLKKKEKPVYEPAPAKIITENFVCEDDGKIDEACIDDSVSKGTTITIAEILSEKEEASTPQSEFEEYLNDSNTPPCNVILCTSEYEKDRVPPDEVDDRMVHITHATIYAEVDDRIGQITDAAVSSEEVDDLTGHIMYATVSNEEVEVDVIGHITYATVSNEEVEVDVIGHITYAPVSNEGVEVEFEVDDVIGHMTYGTVSNEEFGDDTIQFGLDCASFKTVSNLKTLLLSSPSFLTDAEELFHLNTTPNILLTSGTDETITTEMKVCLDYANEYSARRNLPDSQTRYPLLSTCMVNSRISISIEQVVEEVCKGVETLKSYYEHRTYNLPSDSLFAILERDIMCGGVASGTWELGWRCGFSMDEAEEAVSEIEKLITSELIEEVFT